LIVNFCINWSIAKLRRYVLSNHGITEYPDEHWSVSMPRKERYLNVPSLLFIQTKVLTRSTSALVVPQRTFGNERRKGTDETMRRLGAEILIWLT
jgi:hypothetical protein